jgi:hypothetical protein
VSIILTYVKGSSWHDERKNTLSIFPLDYLSTDRALGPANLYRCFSSSIDHHDHRPTPLISHGAEYPGRVAGIGRDTRGSDHRGTTYEDGPLPDPKKWGAVGASHRGFFGHISNECHRLPRALLVALSASRSEGLMVFLEHLADWLGYRFMSFDAGVLVQDGRVVHVDYGLANQWVRPLYPAYVGYAVSARSVHGFWLPRQIPFWVSSDDDESPQYRPSGDKNAHTQYTPTMRHPNSPTVCSNSISAASGA